MFLGKRLTWSTSREQAGLAARVADNPWRPEPRSFDGIEATP